MVKRSSKGGASQKSVDDIEAKLDHAAHGLAALKTLIDDLEAKLDHASHGLAALKALIDAVEGKLDDPAHGLANLKALIDDLEAKLDNATYGLSALRALILVVGGEVAAVEAKLDHGTHGLAALKTLLDNVLFFTTLLTHGTYGLSALKTLIDAVEGKLDVPANFMADVSALALEATLATHDTDIKTLLATIGGYIDTEIAAIEAKLDVPANFMADVSALALEATLATHDSDIKTLFAALNDLSDAEVWAYATRTLTSHAFPFTNPAAALDVSNIRTAAYTLLTDGTYGLSALNTDLDLLLSRLGSPVGASISADIAAVEAKLDNGTYGLAALNTDLDKLLTGIIQGSGTVLPANKSLYDILWVDRHLDEQDSFLWDTSVYTTSETDISALFTTALTGTTRRKYWVYLDMTGPAGDAAAWTEVIVKVQVKIDGANYRTIAKSTKEKTDLASTAEPGIPIEVPMVAQDVKITLQFDVALALDQTIYYHWVQEKMEY